MDLKDNEKKEINPEPQKMLRSILPAAFKISFLSAIGTVIVIGGIMWFFRGKIITSILPILQNELTKQNKVPVFISENGSTRQLKLVSQDDLKQPELSIEETVKKADPSVVSISVSKIVPVYEQFVRQLDPFGLFVVPELKQKGTQRQVVAGGTGFFVSTDGLIITNRHVASDLNAEYTVVTREGKKLQASIVDRDTALDIAVLKVEGDKYPALTTGNSDSLELGQSVVAIGNALAEFNNSVSVGVVSGLSRSVTAMDAYGNSEDLDEVIQTDAAINPGNSGGPLLNRYGEVIGVNVATATGSQNIGFALPINVVKSIIDSVKTYGKIVKPYIGIRFVQITPELKEKEGLSIDHGIIVRKGSKPYEVAVAPGSPADKAGLVEGDIIIEIDGQKITKERGFSYLIRRKSIGQQVVFKVLSKNVAKELTITLVPAPDKVQ